MIENYLLIGLIILTCIVSFYVKSLTFSGAVTALIVGLAVFLGEGGIGLLLLGSFFVSSSLWSKYKSSAKSKMEEKLVKGAQRDWRQVLSNGGAAAMVSILYYYTHHSIWIMAFSVAIASANSDTWASEIGALSKENPIYIRTFRRVEKGTSGAISLLGTVAALSGSAFITLLSFWFFHYDLLHSFIVFFFGFIGNVIDTLIGAYLQQSFLCKNCGMETEKRVHCHQPTIRIKGLSIMENDMVNFLSGVIAVLLAFGFLQLSGLL